MTTWLRHIREVLASSLWFVPAILAVLAVALAFTLVTIDRGLEPSEGAGAWWLYPGGAEGARGVLSAIAGSMVTVAGVVFSVTIVALTLASQQFGPRLLRRFLRDRGNQVVIGTFVAVFVYCLLVLRSVYSDDDAQFVPSLSVTAAVLLATASAGVLIYFIHHAAVSIQASTVIASASREVESSIDRLFPERIGESDPSHEAGAPSLPGGTDDEGQTVCARNSGYVQAFRSERLLEVARKQDLVLRLESRPGDFVAAGSPLARIWPAERATESVRRAIQDAALLGRQRTVEQDIRFAFEGLVEIAVRALSPSLNDPFTAMASIDRLGAGLRQLAGRHTPSSYRKDEQGRLRILAEPVTFVEVAEFAFSLLGHHGRDHPCVMLRLLECIRQIAPDLARPQDREILDREARRTARVALQKLDSDDAPERDAVSEMLEAALRALHTRRPS